MQGLMAIVGADVSNERRRHLEAYLRMVTRRKEAWRCDELVHFLDDKKRTLAWQAALAWTIRLQSALARTVETTSRRHEALRLRGQEPDQGDA